MRRTSEKNYQIDMCNGPLLGKMLLFAIPLMFSGILQLLFNAADIVVVGRFAGDNALAAVGSNTSLINLLTNLFIGLSIGSNVLAARHYGAKRGKELAQTVHTSIFISISSGLLLTVVGILCARWLLILMNTPSEVLPLATTYLRIYFLGMCPLMVYNFGSSLLRATGDTRRPLYYLLLSGVINVVLNLFFVIVCRLSVAGVAIASVISQLISALLVLRCLILEPGDIHLDLHRIHPDRGTFVQILRIGLPAGFQGIIFSLSNVVIQSSINSLGKTVLAGNTAAANLEGFVYMAMNSFHQTTISFTGQNMGAHNHKRIDRIAMIGECCVFVTGTVLGLALIFFERPLLGIYSPDPAVIDAGTKRLHIIAKTYALCGMMDVMVGSLRGMGYSVMPMIVSLVGACGLRLVWIATVFQIPAYHTARVIYLSYPITWIITLCAHVICFFWARSKTLRN